jgi:flagellar biogenesis protein FliO
VDLGAQIGGVLAVLALMAAALWVLGRRGLVQWRGTASGERRMHVVERLPLTAQHALHLVRIGDKLLIVASAPGGCSVLGPLKDGEHKQ